MTNDLREQLLLGKAYALFISELEKHLSVAKERFSKTETLNPKEYAQVRSSFHTIKGGAGFFGFSSVASVASKLEDIMQQPIAKLSAQMDEIHSNLKLIEKLAQELPPPKTDIEEP